jgi:hypothetical protein
VSETFTYTIRADRLAALSAEILQLHPRPSVAAKAEVLSELLDRWLDSLRDKHKLDFIDIFTFMSRLAEFGKLESILSAAQQVPELSVWLSRARVVGGVWAGSPETQAGIAAFVAAGLLTQEEAAALLWYPKPVLPAA